jgi:phage terminase small subunit
MTPRQKRFVEEYARLRNAAEAARRAGYSPFNAAVRGAVLLRSRAVAEALREAGVEVPARAERRASFCRDRDGLTQRQRRFVEHYTILGNASEAARRAGYSEATVKSAGSRLARSPAIVKALDEANAARAQRTRIDGDRVLEEVARLGFVDLADLLDWSGGEIALKPPREIAPADRAALAQITLTTGKDGARLKVKLFDKLRALEILAKHLGLLKPKPPQEKPEWEQRDYREELRWRIERLVKKKEEG